MKCYNLQIRLKASANTTETLAVGMHRKNAPKASALQAFQDVTAKWSSSLGHMKNKCCSLTHTWKFPEASVTSATKKIPPSPNYFISKL